MDAPLIEYVGNDPELRQVDIDYHVSMIARNSEQLVQFQADRLKLQAAQAAATVRGLELQAAQTAATVRGISEISRHQETTNILLANSIEELRIVERGIDELNVSMNNLTETVSLGFASLQSEIRQSFEGIVEQMLRQQKQLCEIANILRQPYETQVLEVRKEADKWLTVGMQETGQDRNESFQDALELLQECVKNPIGKQDYVAWFQIGWLGWKYQNNLADAEEAFDRARRLSKPEGNLYYLKSLRHLAYMQYLQHRYEDAYRTLKDGLNSYDHDALFDLARYAAKLGKEEEALNLLDCCIDLRPTTFYTMFAEADFQ